MSVPGVSGGKMNVHSENAISRVIACMSSVIEPGRLGERQQLVAFDSACR